MIGGSFTDRPGLAPCTNRMRTRALAGSRTDCLTAVVVSTFMESSQEAKIEVKCMSNYTPQYTTPYTTPGLAGVRYIKSRANKVKPHHVCTNGRELSIDIQIIQAFTTGQAIQRGRRLNCSNRKTGDVI